jgi:hypothetical protein
MWVPQESLHWKVPYVVNSPILFSLVLNIISFLFFEPKVRFLICFHIWVPDNYFKTRSILGTFWKNSKLIFEIELELEWNFDEISLSYLTYFIPIWCMLDYRGFIHISLSFCDNTYIHKSLHIYRVLSCLNIPLSRLFKLRWNCIGNKLDSGYGCFLLFSYFYFVFLDLVFETSQIHLFFLKVVKYCWSAVKLLMKLM